jgi:hypothetical protein
MFDCLQKKLFNSSTSSLSVVAEIQLSRRTGIAGFDWCCVKDFVSLNQFFVEAFDEFICPINLF